jgi:hypothetical protein
MDKRDLLGRSIDRHEHTPSKDASRLKSAAETAGLCFEELPSVSFNMIKTWTCCDNITTINMSSKGTGNVRRITGFRVGWIQEGAGVTLQDYFNWYFGRRDTDADKSEKDRVPNEKRPSCTRGAGCTKNIDKQWVVLDRLPPLLVIFWEQSESLQDIEKRRFFDDLSVGYCTTRATNEGRVYVCVGVIFWKWSASNANHYVFRWKPHGQREIWEYDGLRRGGQFGEIGSNWVSGLDLKRDQVSTLFFRIEDSSI